MDSERHIGMWIYSFLVLFIHIHIFGLFLKIILILNFVVECSNSKSNTQILQRNTLFLHWSKQIDLIRRFRYAEIAEMMKNLPIACKISKQEFYFYTHGEKFLSENLLKSLKVKVRFFITHRFNFRDEPDLRFPLTSSVKFQMKT